MGRIRTIKPEILEDEDTANLSHEAFRLFIGMITLADDHGNLRAQPRWLGCQVFWASSADAEVALTEITRAKLVDLYEVEGEVYAHIKGWTKHQKVDKPGRPRVPLYSEEFARPSRDPRELSRDPRETLATDLRPPTSDQGSGSGSRSGTTTPKGSTRGRSPVARVAESDIDLVVAHYRGLHRAARPGKKEREKIRDRLHEGYTIDDLKGAIDGQHASPWHQGRNDRNKPYLSLELAMRDSTHVLDFLERATPSGAPNPDQGRNAFVDSLESMLSPGITARVESEAEEEYDGY